MDFSKYTNIELIDLYSETISAMKARGIIHSNNVVGDLGEYAVVEHYCNTAVLPKLQFAPVGTKNIDAISINGERYSIKSITTNTTGAFYGIDKDAKYEDVKPVFEYLVIARFDKDFQLIQILEMTWETFFKHKRWHSRMGAHNVSLTKDTINDAKIIFDKADGK